MRKIVTYIGIAVLVIFVMILSIFGPSIVSVYTDSVIFENITMEPLDSFTGGYHYRLTSNERMYILAASLGNQALPQSNLYAATLKEYISESNSKNMDVSFAFAKNNRGPSDNELNLSELLTICERELKELCKLGILPLSEYYVIKEIYDINLYSAVDTFEPQKNLSVWQIKYSPDLQIRDIKNTLLDAYIDAETGKLYGFSVRIEKDWEELNPDEMIRLWCNYMELGEYEAYEENNMFLENTAYYKKYLIDGLGIEKILVTIGFHKGIKELFFKFDIIQL